VAEPNSVKQQSVLVIDDEAGLRDMLAFGLPDRGFRVVVAASGEVGVEKIRQEPFDLVVTDMMMPGISGVEVLKQIKQIQPKTEVIMATGFATLETAVESMKLGAYDYISKPYSLDQLCQVLEKAREHQRLTNQVSHLEELNRLKTEFVAYMSHELRTPMNAIISYVSMALEKTYGEFSPAQEQMFRRIESNGRNLLGIINNILDLSKLSAERMTLSIESCDLTDIVHDVLATMECLAEERHLKLSAELPALLPLRTDKAKLRQVLINLVGNAIKFTHQGSVTIKAEIVNNLPQLRLCVQDTGIGIKPEDIPLLFEEFRQLDATSTRRYEGTGLGLSITKKIIELFHGTVQIESTVGLGSTFIVTLPLEIA
jgi:signal transduction histidine kinase